MCGIGGWLGTISDERETAAGMVAALHHRGPDSQDVRFWPHAALLHTRLSILDLSEKGNQPISNENQTVWVVFNGEIYNHRELRQGLLRRGHLLRGRSDSEVLPHLYEELGTDLFKVLRGMFAIAIYDSVNHSLVLARDRFGIKPCFYAPGERSLAFASEIRALREIPEVDDRVDRQAVSDYAALLYVPAPQTFYKGIRALRPGEILVAELKQHCVFVTTRQFHHWSIAPNDSITFEHAVDQADALIIQAVQKQLESDVALGALLSGGIDSSLVTAAMHQGGAGPIPTFNVRFSDKKFDETWAALAVAHHCRSKHRTLDMGNLGGSWEAVTELLLHAGQPFADTSIFPCNLVCRNLRQFVTVALSGDGGDEGFGGYDHFWQLKWIAGLQQLPKTFANWLAIAVQQLAVTGAVRPTLAQRVRQLSRASDAEIVGTLFSWVRDDEHRRLCRHLNSEPVSRLFERQWEHALPSRASQEERLSALLTEAHLRINLPSCYLFKVDIASMKENLEVRVPMLDEDVFQLGLSLPHHFKARGRTGKVVLRAVARRRLPAAVANKPKWGFGIPFDRWVDSEFKTKLRERLLGPSSSLPEYFDPEVYQPFVDAFCSGRQCPGITRQGLFQRATMLLALDLASRSPPARRVLPRPLPQTCQPSL